jgi:hypothetical protein
LRLGGLGSFALAVALASMASGGPDLFIGFAPIARLRFRIRPVPLKGGAILERWRLGPRVPRIKAAVLLRGRGAGKQERRHYKKN